MLLELIGFFGIIITLMVLVAEFGKNYAGGVIAGVLIMILGGYIFLDGIQIQTGELSLTDQNLTISTYSCNNNATGCSEGTDTSSGTITTTTAYTYSNIPIMPFIGFDELMGIVFVLVGLYTIFVYTYK